MQLKSATLAAEHKIKELEQQLSDLENNVKDIENAYVEKSKKCEAWERAYKSMKRKHEKVGDSITDVDNSIDRPIMLNISQSSDVQDERGYRYYCDKSYSTPQYQYSTLRPLCSPSVDTPKTRVIRRTETTTVRQSTNSSGEKDPIDTLSRGSNIFDDSRTNIRRDLSQSTEDFSSYGHLATKPPTFQSEGANANTTIATTSTNLGSDTRLRQLKKTSSFFKK